LLAILLMDMGPMVNEQAGHGHIVTLDRSQQQPLAHVISLIHITPFW
jgi:hypothetical protein